MGGIAIIISGDHHILWIDEEQLDGIPGMGYSSGAICSPNQTYLKCLFPEKGSGEAHLLFLSAFPGRDGYTMSRQSMPSRRQRTAKKQKTRGILLLVGESALTLPTHSCPGPRRWLYCWLGVAFDLGVKVIWVTIKNDLAGELGPKPVMLGALGLFLWQSLAVRVSPCAFSSLLVTVLKPFSPQDPCKAGIKTSLKLGPCSEFASRLAEPPVCSWATNTSSQSKPVPLDNLEAGFQWWSQRGGEKKTLSVSCEGLCLAIPMPWTLPSTQSQTCPLPVYVGLPGKIRAAQLNLNFR